MDQIHGSEQKAGQNRLPYLVLDWELSYVPLGHENVLRALCLSRIGSHPSPLAQFGQCFPCSIRRLETPFRVLFSTRILVKTIKNNEFHDFAELGPFQKEQARSADQQKWYSNVWAMKSDQFRTKSSFFGSFRM